MVQYLYAMHPPQLASTSRRRLTLAEQRKHDSSGLYRSRIVVGRYSATTGAIMSRSPKEDAARLGKRRLIQARLRASALVKQLWPLRPTVVERKPRVPPRTYPFSFHSQSTYVVPSYAPADILFSPHANPYLGYTILPALYATQFHPLMLPSHFHQPDLDFVDAPFVTFLHSFYPPASTPTYIHDSTKYESQDMEVDLLEESQAIVSPLLPKDSTGDEDKEPSTPSTSGDTKVELDLEEERKEGSQENEEEKQQVEESESTDASKASPKKTDVDQEDTATVVDETEEREEEEEEDAEDADAQMQSPVDDSAEKNEPDSTDGNSLRLTLTPLSLSFPSPCLMSTDSSSLSTPADIDFPMEADLLRQKIDSLPAEEARDPEEKNESDAAESAVQPASASPLSPIREADEEEDCETKSKPIVRHRYPTPSTPSIEASPHQTRPSKVAPIVAKIFSGLRSPPTSPEEGVMRTSLKKSLPSKTRVKGIAMKG